MNIRLAFIVTGIFGLAAACGVKGPPLPPVADTPQSSDSAAMTGGTAPVVEASPVPSPTPKSKTKKRR